MTSQFRRKSTRRNRDAHDTGARRARQADALSRRTNLVRPSVALGVHREQIRRVVEANHARNPRVFGSVLHGTDLPGSDLDLLVDPIQGVTTLLDIAGIQIEVQALLGISVDVVTPGALPDKFRDRVLGEAITI